MDAELHQHRVAVRSRSLLNALVTDDSRLLSTIALKYTAEAQVHVQKVRYLSNVKWIYYEDYRAEEYGNNEALQLESAFSAKHTEIRITDDIFVSFRIMAHIVQGKIYKIQRYETVSSSTAAGEIIFRTLDRADHPFDVEVQQYETHYPVGSYSICSDFVAIARKFGLGMQGNWLIGTQSDLEHATKEMDASLRKFRMEIQCKPLPVGLSVQTAKEIGKEMKIAINGRMVYGPAEDLMQFVQLIDAVYSSVPVPLGVPEEEIEVICKKYELVRAEGYMFGRKDGILQALADITQTKAPIPPGIDAEKLQKILADFRLRQSGDFIVGQIEQVTAALVVIQRQEYSAVYPKPLLQLEVEAVCQRHAVRVDGERIFGLQPNVLAALGELIPMEQTGAFRFHRAPGWYSANQTEIEVVELQSTDQDFVEVAALFMKTSLNRITRIRQIQNRKLYTNFAFKHEGYSRAENRIVEIRRLFHGTSGIDPKTIYESDSGLDSRLGKGMWGAGTYFAQNASYSAGYAHAAADGTHEMFLCEVIVGDYVQLPSTPTLVKPPLKPSSTSAYHSVKGFTGGSDIWITYEPAMSYPHYLINYR